MNHYYIDYHCHTCMSGDSDQTMEDLVLEALHRNVKELCISEHFNFYPGTYCFGRFSYTDQDAERQRLSALYPEIRLLLGLEMDYTPEFMPIIRQMGRDLPLDYFLGSCHRSRGEHVWNKAFFEGRSKEEAYGEYFETVLACVREKTFDTIAHFDWAKRMGCHLYGPFDMTPYRDIIAEALREMINSDMTMEVNEAGLRHDAKEPYPSYEILALYRDLGGENITYASDSHHLGQTSARNEEVYERLRQLGFRWITTFERRRKKRLPL